MKPQLELRVKAHLKRTIVIPNESVLAPSCCRGTQKKCATLSQRFEHSVQAGCQSFVTVLLMAPVRVESTLWTGRTFLHLQWEEEEDDGRLPECWITVTQI